jgi:transglutaminase-like putative cysteine protease
VSDARYVVVHETRYEYDQPVGISRQVVHLTPRTTSWQTCSRHRLDVTPEPEQLTRSVDAFGNAIGSFYLEADHSSLSVRAESWVELSARGLPPAEQTPAWDRVQARLAYQGGRRLDPADLDATRYLFESTRVRNKRELATWSAACFPSGTPLLVGVRSLMERIHRDLTFDPKATIVSTPVMEVFERRRGVCQDFAHLMLSCLRSLGLAARYVSGYVLTRPPPGKPRLVGADASHAWVSVYCPGHGWIDADPTNGVFPSLEHVTLGWGRDYDDVIPLRGVLLGGGSHTLEIEVTVAPEADHAALFG